MADRMGGTTARRILTRGLLPEIAASLQQPSHKVHGTLWPLRFTEFSPNEFTLEIYGG